MYHRGVEEGGGGGGNTERAGGHVEKQRDLLCDRKLQKPRPSVLVLGYSSGALGRCWVVLKMSERGGRGRAGRRGLVRGGWGRAGGLSSWETGQHVRLDYFC